MGHNGCFVSGIVPGGGNDKLRLQEGKAPTRWMTLPKGKPPRPLPKDVKLIWNFREQISIVNPLYRHSTLGCKWVGKDAMYGFWAFTNSKRKIVKAFWKYFAGEYYRSKGEA